MIDLWSASGPPPRTMSDVLWREKQIQCASRTAAHIDAVATKVNLRHAIGLLKAAGPRALGDAVPDDGVTAGSRLDIVHIVYHPTADPIPNSDAEFSRASIRERRLAGHADMQRAIAAAPWFRREKPPHRGATVHRVADETVTTLTPLDPHRTSDQAAPPPSAAPNHSRRKRA